MQTHTSKAMLGAAPLELCQSGMVYQCRNYGAASPLQPPPEGKQGCPVSRHGYAGALGEASRMKCVQVQPALSHGQNYPVEIRSDSSSRTKVFYGRKSSTGTWPFPDELDYRHSCTKYSGLYVSWLAAPTAPLSISSCQLECLWVIKGPLPVKVPEACGESQLFLHSSTHSFSWSQEQILMCGSPMHGFQLSPHSAQLLCLLSVYSLPNSHVRDMPVVSVPVWELFHLVVSSQSSCP